MLDLRRIYNVGCTFFAIRRHSLLTYLNVNILLSFTWLYYVYSVFIYASETAFWGKKRSGPHASLIRIGFGKSADTRGRGQSSPAFVTRGKSIQFIYLFFFVFTACHDETPPWDYDKVRASFQSADLKLLTQSTIKQIFSFLIVILGLLKRGRA